MKTYEWECQECGYKNMSTYRHFQCPRCGYEPPIEDYKKAFEDLKLYSDSYIRDLERDVYEHMHNENLQYVTIKTLIMSNVFVFILSAITLIKFVL